MKILLRLSFLLLLFFGAAGRTEATAISSEDYCQQASQYETCGDLTTAYELYEKAILTDDQNAAAYNAKGLICYKTGNYAEAHTCFTNAIAIDSAFAKAYENRSKNYRAIGAYSAAAADQKQVESLRNSKK